MAEVEASTAAVTSPRLNVADRLAEFAARSPDRVAVVCQRRRRAGYATITFGELDADATRIARGLVAWGVTPGTRLALFVRPGIDFVALVFGLLRAGAVIVLIDPGLGRKNLVRCLADAEPEGFIAIPVVHAIRLLLRRQVSPGAMECHGRSTVVLENTDARGAPRARQRRERREPAGSPRRRSCRDHLHVRQHRPAQGRTLHAADVRHAGGRNSVDVCASNRAASTSRALRCSRCSTRRWV